MLFSLIQLQLVTQVDTFNTMEHQVLYLEAILHQLWVVLLVGLYEHFLLLLVVPKIHLAMYQFIYQTIHLQTINHTQQTLLLKIMLLVGRRLTELLCRLDFGLTVQQSVELILEQK